MTTMNTSMVNGKWSNGKWLLLLAAVALVSCQFKNQSFVDFEGLDTIDWAGSETMFMPTRITYSELGNAFPEDCYFMDGTPVNQLTEEELVGGLADNDAANSPARTTSIPGSNILQALLSYGNQSRLTQISGVYSSLNSDYEDCILSGKVIMPADGKFKRYILVSHYTIGSNAEAPSNCFSLEGVLAKLGYALIIPDYEGYGITADRIHPYLMMDLTALQVVDMFFAVRKYMEARGIRPEHDDIYLMGYSQGGATTMAVQRLLETAFMGDVEIRRVFAGGGPYDVKATYERFVTTDVASYPVAVPLVLQGMIYGAKLNITCEEMMAKRVYENMDEWVNSKKYCTKKINDAIGSYVTHEILSPISMDQNSRQVAELYQAMTDNSIVSYSWTPQAPVYMLHSIDDETVPYTNATLAKNKWKGANIQFNFGHYGGHVKGCLRFIYTVQTLLKEEQKEEEDK